MVNAHGTDGKDKVPQQFAQACRDNGLDPALVVEAAIRCLSEQTVQAIMLTEVEWRAERSQSDALDRFMKRLQQQTGREWPQAESIKMRDLIDRRYRHKVRVPLDFGTKIAMLFNREMKCSMCGKSTPEIELHIDHIYPWSKGGTNTLENLQFLCSFDNLRKSNKIGGL